MPETCGIEQQGDAAGLRLETDTFAPRDAANNHVQDTAA